MDSERVRFHVDSQQGSSRGPSSNGPRGLLGRSLRINVVIDGLIIREVAHGSPAYWATVALRDSVLRRPLGLQFSVEQLRAEEDSRHIACYRDDTLVGCLILRPIAGGDVQMRQVAVVAQLQGQGIGRAMVEYSEALARTIGFTRIILHARETAVPFYENLGYAKVGERFLELTIPHWAMERSLTSQSPTLKGERR